ncbi:hypothetical protein CHUAL_009713 [Chamberlinius hualienensis]
MESNQPIECPVILAIMNSINIQGKLKAHDYIRTGDQIKAKLKNLGSYYIKDKNNTSGQGTSNCDFFHEFNKIYGTRDITNKYFDSLQDVEIIRHHESFENQASPNATEGISTESSY